MSYLEVSGVSKTIGPEQVLDHVSFAVEQGEVVGLEGKNGSGKTMAMRAVCGLIRPTEGEVRVAGKLLWKDVSFPQSVGLLIEAPALLGGYSALENLRLMASIKGVAGRGALRHAIERVGLDPDERKHVRKYSLGMKQRLGLAMALMEAPELLVLDEPTNALDEKGHDMLVEIVRQERAREAAILLSSHDADFLCAVCDRVCHMRSGRVTDVEEVGAHEVA